jgi:hypothetical protein
MLMNLALSLPFLDVDRMTPTSPNGGKIGARAVIVLAWVAVCAVWLVFRLNDYFIR